MYAAQIGIDINHSLLVVYFYQQNKTYTAMKIKNNFSANTPRMQFIAILSRCHMFDRDLLDGSHFLLHCYSKRSKNIPSYKDARAPAFFNGIISITL